MMRVSPACFDRQACDLGVEDKRAALKRILQSEAFARADQLKQILSYVCELEIAGRAAEITEFRIGVEILGKPADFTPVDDASVRNRTYALRKKLEKFYAEEDRNAAIRIEFVKGSYVPRFVRAADSAANGVQLILPHETTKTRAKPWQHLLVLLSGIAIGTALGFWSTSLRRTEHINPMVREAWGPLLGSKREVIISLGVPAQLTLLPFKVRMEWQPQLPFLEAPPRVYAWYARQHRLPKDNRLYLDPDVNSPHFGDVLGAITAINTLNAAGHAYKLLPERAVSPALLTGYNVLLVGVPHKSEAVCNLLEKTPFRFRYDETLQDVVITQTFRDGRHKDYLPKRNERNDRVESYGLLTVLPGRQDNGRPGRTVIFSGDPSAGAAAASAFFSSAGHLSGFRDRLRRQGYSRLPPAYQVLLRCKLDSNLLVSFAYEAHAVIEPQ